MEDILDSHEAQTQPEQRYIVASKGKRFANYVIDTIGYLLFAVLIGLIIGLSGSAADSTEFFEEEQSSGLGSLLMEYLIGFIMIITYYTFLEYVLKGKSLGKLITGTRAITVDNQRMDFGTTLKRSACRVIPFEAFTFLGDNARGLHDSLSNTKVILDEGWSEETYV